MSNITLLEIASATSDQEGTPINLSGAEQSIEITADSYGTDGKVVLKTSSNGETFTTLSDINTGISDKAIYESDIIILLGKLGPGWSLRADLEISAGTATNVKVITSPG